MSIPISAAASMTVLPLVVATSLPSIVSLIGSIKTRRLLCWSGGVMECCQTRYSNTPLLHSYHAAFLRDVFLKFFAILFYKRRRRHCRRVAKRTDGVAHDIVADVENKTEIALVALALFSAAKNLFHPVTAFAARAALTARLMGEKTRKVPRGPNHAGGIVHHNDPARAEQTSCRLDGFIVEIYFLQLVRAQHRHRTATGNDPLELSAVGHAAAIFVKKFHEWIAHLQFIDAGLADVAAHAEELGAFALFRAHGCVGCRAVLDDPRKRRQRLDIVNHRRAAEKTMGRRKRRFKLRPPSPAFQRRQQRRFFAANVSAGPSVNDHVYIVT